MTLGSWDPDAEQAKNNLQLTDELLQRFIAMNDDLDNLSEKFSTDEQQSLSAVMHFDHDTWRQATTSLSDTEIETLIRFFTVAEKLPGWEAGPESPVIKLSKILKHRGTGINRELVIWIKQHSNNRFLPHGPLL